MDYFTDIKNFIVDNFLFGENGCLENDTRLLENGIIDSTGVLELLSFLERNYGIHIEDHEIISENLDSIANINRFLKEKSQAAI